MLATIVGAVGLVVGLMLLWTGRRRLEVTSFQATLLTIIDVAGFLISIVALGLLGVAIFIAVSVVAVLAWSVVLAMKKQSILVSASAQSASVSTDEAEDIYRWMGQDKSFAAMPPLTRAEIVRALAARARNPREIRPIAVQIARLATVFECDPVWLAPRFDQIVRRYGYSADQAAKAANEVASGAQQMAASFEEAVEALLIVVDGPVGVDAPRGSATLGHQVLDNLRAIAALQIAQEGVQGVRLNGGPMDGWLTLPDAPCLKADWHKTWPPNLKQHNDPGRYQLARSGRWADWILLPEAGH
jgi:hypothetical protein